MFASLPRQGRRQTIKLENALCVNIYVNDVYRVSEYIDHVFLFPYRKQITGYSVI